VPGPDPTHWLHRLTPAEWLGAAANELAQATAALDRRAARPALAHARRAAGMAWNAVLIDHPDPGAGRSYMEHLVALAAGGPDEIRAAAKVLCQAPSTQPPLIRLRAPGEEPGRDLVQAARVILDHATRVVAPG
jgi:HEPN domain-containing protein